MEILLPISSLRFPSDSRTLFGRDAPVVVELGVGSGEFMARLAKGRPDLNILGVDRAPQSVARSFRRLRSVGAPNARLIKADAAFVIRNVLPRHGMSRVYVNFPDPWPRRRHHHRRLLHPPFLRLLASRLTGKGEIFVTTDHPGYFEFVLESAESTGVFQMERGEPPEEVLETKWARKGTSHYFAALQPHAPVDGPDVDVELDDDMYHAVLEGNLPDPSDLGRPTFKFRDGVVVVLEVYRSSDRSGLAFLLHVEEKNLSQEVIVEARQGENGVVAGLKRFGEPLHTRGLGVAVRCIVERLEESGMTIRHRKY